MNSNINVQIPEEQKYVAPPEEPKKKKSKLPVIIIILIILIGAGVGCWYFLFNKEDEKEEPKQEEKEEVKEEVKVNNKIKNAYEEYSGLPKNGFKFTIYCDEYRCGSDKSDVDNAKTINQTCVGKTLKECYPGQRDENQDTDKVDGFYNYNVITDSGYIILNDDNFAYRCINSDCLYINDEQGKLFVYDGKIYMIDIKNETRTELDLSFKDIFEGQKEEDFYDDGHISFIITKEKKVGDSVVNEYSDHIIEYTSSNGGQAAETYFYDLNTNKKTTTPYYEYSYVELNGNKYIFGSSIFSEPGYAGIINADTLEEVKLYKDANNIILDEKNKQILVAFYLGEGRTSNDSYKVIHKLDYNLKEIK